MTNVALEVDRTQSPSREPASAGLTMGTLASAGRQAWDRYVAGHERGTVYHQSVWKDIIEREFSHQTHYLCAEREASIVGVLPLVRLRSRLFGDFIVSLPYLNYGGPIGDSAEVENALMAQAQRLCTQAGVSHAEIRETVARQGWPCRTDKVSMTLELPEDADVLWQSVGKKRRSDVRRSRKRGATVRHGRDDLLDAFYSVFSRNMRDIGTPVYARSFFQNILHHLPWESSITAVFMDDQPVAAGFLIRDGDRIEIPWASALREYNAHNVNTLLYWSVLKEAIDGKAKVFDFGRSSAGSGTQAFKRRWGATEHQLYWHYWLRDEKSMPDLTPNNPKFRLAVAMWRRLPLMVTNALGPHLVKNLP